MCSVVSSCVGTGEEEHKGKERLNIRILKYRIMFLYYNQITDLDKKALLKKKGFCKYFKLPPNKRRPNLIKSTIKIHLIQGYIKNTHKRWQNVLLHPKFYHSSLRISLSWRNLKSSRCKSGILISLVLPVSGRWSFACETCFSCTSGRKRLLSKVTGRNFSTELIKIIPSPLVSLQSVFPQLLFFVHAKTKPWGFCHIFGTAPFYEKRLLCNTNLNKICKLFFFYLSLVNIIP